MAQEMPPSDRADRARSALWWLLVLHAIAIFITGAAAGVLLFKDEANQRWWVMVGVAVGFIFVTTERLFRIGVEYRATAPSGRPSEPPPEKEAA